MCLREAAICLLEARKYFSTPGTGMVDSRYLPLVKAILVSGSILRFGGKRAPHLLLHDARTRSIDARLTDNAHPLESGGSWWP